jgi:hypothetical protein
MALTTLSCATALACDLCLLQKFAIVDILEAQKQVTGSILGKALVDKLTTDPVMTKNERTFFTMVIGRYLVKKCAT